MLEKAEFGIYKTFFENVLTTVNLQPILSTIPSIFLSGDLINSPTLKGLSRKIIKPPKKFDKRSLAAKPTTKPPTPPNASKPEILKPNSCISVNAVIIITIILNILIVISYVSSTTLGSSPSFKFFKNDFLP